MPYKGSYCDGKAQRQLHAARTLIQNSAQDIFVSQVDNQIYITAGQPSGRKKYVHNYAFLPIDRRSMPKCSACDVWPAC